jgi:L-ascorbate metabolism protein UlaG (beta-lactamase superfamily)
MAQAAHQAGFYQVEELEPWQTAMLGGVKVTATPAKHGVPENCYVLEKDDTTVFFGGDTLFIPELREVARRAPKIDLALLPVNGLQIRPLFNRQVVMNAKEAAELCAILRPRVAVPIHYAFTAGPIRDRLLLKYTGTAEEFAREAARRAPETTVRILPPGEQFPIHPTG